MFRKLAVICAMVSFCTVSSFALAGIGISYAPNPLATIEANTANLNTTISGVELDQKESKGLFGFGAKVWVDALPFIDLEASGYVQFARYEVNINAVGETIPLKVSSGLPLVPDAQPAFGKVVGELSVLYPFLKFPPVLKLAKFYVGGGISYIGSTALLDEDLIKDILQKTAEDNAGLAASGSFDDDAKESLAKNAVDVIKDEGLQSGVGGHIVLGVKVKPPVVPIAVFADVKYHIGGGLPDDVSNGITLEIGGGLAF